ncbi:MAG: transcriptional regulator [Deltaproteobacteria bacterium]|nr:transcriptional regulator [Deltaproteobacteria bacterium]
MKEIKPIRNDRDYRTAVKRIEALMDAEPGTSEFDELEILGTLVDAYEERRFRIAPPDPVDAVRFRMEQLGLTRKDLERYIGWRGRVSEVMGRRRTLSLTMIRKLHRGLGIPAEALISE